jgi:hypothetical protein
MLAKQDPSRGYGISYRALNEKEIITHVAYQENKDKGQLQLTLWLKNPPGFCRWRIVSDQ